MKSNGKSLTGRYIKVSFTSIIFNNHKTAFDQWIIKNMSKNYKDA